MASSLTLENLSDVIRESISQYFVSQKADMASALTLENLSGVIRESICQYFVSRKADMAVPPTIENLPTELQTHILKQSRDFETLRSLILASLSLHKVYVLARLEIWTAVTMNIFEAAGYGFDCHRISLVSFLDLVMGGYWLYGGEWEHRAPLSLQQCKKLVAGMPFWLSQRQCQMALATLLVDVSWWDMDYGGSDLARRSSDLKDIGLRYFLIERVLGLPAYVDSEDVLILLKSKPLPRYREAIMAKLQAVTEESSTS